MRNAEMYDVWLSIVEDDWLDPDNPKHITDEDAAFIDKMLRYWEGSIELNPEHDPTMQNSKIRIYNTVPKLELYRCKKILESCSFDHWMDSLKELFHELRIPKFINMRIESMKYEIRKSNDEVKQKIRIAQQVIYEFHNIQLQLIP